MIKICKGSHRRTECYKLWIGTTVFYISYNTIIAITTEEGGRRLENTWGPTTGRHMTEMGIRSWPVITDEKMEVLIKQSLMRTGAEIAMKPFQHWRNHEADRQAVRV